MNDVHSEEMGKHVPPYLCGQMAVKVDNLEKSIKIMSKIVTNQGKSLGRVERKVFNGFGTKIDNLSLTMRNDREVNEKAHTEMKKTLRAIIKFGATSFIAIFVVLLSILGSLWLHNETVVPTEVIRNVPIVVPESTSS